MAFLRLRNLISFTKLTLVWGKSDCSETRHLMIDFSWTTLHWSCSSHDCFEKNSHQRWLLPNITERPNSNHWEYNRRKQADQSCREIRPKVTHFRRMPLSTSARTHRWPTSIYHLSFFSPGTCRTGFAIITWNNPKKLEKPWITKGLALWQSLGARFYSVTVGAGLVDPSGETQIFAMLPMPVAPQKKWLRLDFWQLAIGLLPKVEWYIPSWHNDRPVTLLWDSLHILDDVDSKVARQDVRVPGLCLIICFTLSFIVKTSAMVHSVQEKNVAFQLEIVNIDVWCQDSQDKPSFIGQEPRKQLHSDNCRHGAKSKMK